MSDESDDSNTKSKIANFVSGVETQGFGFSLSSKKVTVLHQDTLTQKPPYRAEFDLNSAKDCRQFLDAFIDKPDIRIDLSSKEYVVVKVIETISKAPSFSTADIQKINKAVEIAGYGSNRDISKALAIMNQTADNRGLGKAVADNTKETADNRGLGKAVADNTTGAIAQNRKTLNDAETMR